jgi:hypothetical protein
MVGGTMSISGTDKQQIVGADEGEEFIVDRIVNHRMRNGRKEYLLSWKGYPEEENTWVEKFSFPLKINSLFSNK